MGNKIFISYKYADHNVKSLSLWQPATPRNYVDIIQKKLPKYDHINKGEDDNESLEHFKRDTIHSKLADKIFDSSITIVLISPNMKSYGPQKDQWIPWEISYSLRNQNRLGIYSRPNAILEVILPDVYGSYSYIEQPSFGFDILKLNKNNLSSIFNSYDSSYVVTCTWAQFNSQFDTWIDKALTNRKNVDKYNLRVNV